MNERAVRRRSHEQLADVVAELRGEGWHVELEPRITDLPGLLNFRPDLLARRGNEILIGEIASRVSAVKERLDAHARIVQRIPNAKFEVFWLGDAPEEEPRVADIRALSNEASLIAHQVSPTAALLVAWAALEGAIARYAAAEQGSGRPHAARQQLASLYSRGLINKDDFDRLSRLWKLRSAIAHQASRVAPTLGDIAFVLALADRMATDRYVSVDEIVEWYLATHGESGGGAHGVREALKKHFPNAMRGDLDQAVELLSGLGL